jgi:hypothetical protein
MIGASGDYTAMTTNGGVEELLFLVDGRNETLMVYRVLNGREVRLMERQDLRSLFSTARAAYLGAPPAGPAVSADRPAAPVRGGCRGARA